MSRQINIMIVPEGGGKRRTLRVSVTTVRLALWGGAVLALGLLAILASFGNLLRKATNYDHLAADKAELEKQNRRIIAVSQEMEQSRRLISQIVRTLGGKIDLGVLGAADSLLRVSDLNQSSGGSEGLAALLGQQSLGTDQILSYGLPTLMPINGFITQGFRDDPLFPSRSHRGIDIAGRTGAPVAAAADGWVVFSGWSTYFGNCLLMAHQGGYLTFYGHNQINLKAAGEEVKRGEPIALLGTSGHSSAPHLHFEIWKDGVALDPQGFVESAGGG